MSSELPGFSAADALLYLCASRGGLERLSRILIGTTLAAGLVSGLVMLLTR